MLLAACHPSTGVVSDLNSKTVTLPDGFEVIAELKVAPQDMAQGMMGRDALAAGRGMLFVHASPGTYSYWMHNCKIPLDIIWMDPGHAVVEVSENTPPCQREPSACPSYGGHQVSQFVLELGAGEAKKHGVAPGKSLSF
jgi:uncharacterized membrane protein (UPF0127 family)